MTTSSPSVEKLANVIRGFNKKGWCLGTSGNFSAVISNSPFELIITRSGIDKEYICPEDFLILDNASQVISGSGIPSAETAIHYQVIKQTDAKAILHTHSVWNTLISEKYFSAGGVSLSGYEMLKALNRVSTHNHSEWLPIVENSQDMEILGKDVQNVMIENPELHGFLIRGHGLYTWGKDLSEAKRHVEGLEFLLEVHGRKGEFENGHTASTG